MAIIKAIILNDLIEFIDYWFNHKPRSIIRNFFDVIYKFDKVISVRAHLRNINKPLYGDYTFIGYAIALPYRIFMIIFGIIVYLFISIFYFLIVLIWILIPLLTLSYGVLF